MKMLPTNELRFVERKVPFWDETDKRFYDVGHTARVLQQRWEEEWMLRDGTTLKDEGEPIASEWRDVPLEKES